MGLPWDDDKVVRNLEIIARLQNGDKLSVLKRGATPTDPQFDNLGNGGRGLRDIFDVQRGGWSKVKQAIERARKGEDLLNDLQYLTPLTHIFEAALRLWHEQTITQIITIANAYQGLQRMGQTYAGNATHTAKMQAILRAAQPFVPPPDAQRCVMLKGNKVLDLTTTTAFADLRNSFGGFMDASQNTMRNEAYQDATSNLNPITRERMMTDMYGGTGPSLAPPTAIPTMPGTPYVRQSTGVCESYWLDHHRQGPLLDRTTLPFGEDTAEGVGILFEALNDDEAMLFVVSQVASQGGLNGVPSFLFGHRTAAKKQSRTNDWALGCQNFRFFPIRFRAPIVEIQVLENCVEVGVFSPLDTTEQNGIFTCKLFEDPQTDIPVPTTGTLLGINFFAATMAVRLRRNGPAITWELTEAKIQFNVQA